MKLNQLGYQRQYLFLLNLNQKQIIRKFVNGKKPKNKQKVSKNEAKVEQTESKTEGNVNVNDNLNANENENKKEKFNYSQFVSFWNTSFENKLIPKITSITEVRKKAIRAVLKEFKEDELISAVNKLKESNFANGVNDHKWTANFDWLMNVKNIAKVLEGNYDNRIEAPKKRAIY